MCGKTIWNGGPADGRDLNPPVIPATPTGWWQEWQWDWATGVAVEWQSCGSDLQMNSLIADDFIGSDYLIASNHTSTI